MHLHIKTDGTVEGTTITDEGGAMYASAVSVSVRGGPLESVSIVAAMGGAAGSAVAELPLASPSGGDSLPEPENAVTTSAPKRTNREKKEE